jgi:hypothetical protein
MRSLSLEIPMRVELPLRALPNGEPDLTGTDTLHLHALTSDDGQHYVYYGEQPALECGSVIYGAPYAASDH